MGGGQFYNFKFIGGGEFYYLKLYWWGDTLTLFTLRKELPPGAPQVSRTIGSAICALCLSEVCGCGGVLVEGELCDLCEVVQAHKGLCHAHVQVI